MMHFSVSQLSRGAGVTFKGGDMKGFTLVEVLVVSFIIMVGVTGFVTLQSEFMRNDAKLNLRGVAMQLAQEKMDDLRQFDVLEVTPGEVAYNDIDDDLGGTLAAGEVLVRIKTDAGRTYSFTRNWQVTDQYYVDTDADGQADTWVPEGDPAVPVPTPVLSGKKVVEVSVTWTEHQGGTKSLQLEGSVAPVPVSRSFQATNETDNAKAQPTVNYTPGLAPDVIAYDLGNGESIETSKPVPDIDNRGENNIVQFETIRYIDLPEQNDKLEQEDFLTVNCACKLAGNGEGFTPSMTIYDGSELVVQSGEKISKTTGVVADNQQPPICNACCRDHHDTGEMISSEVYYRAESGNPHKHYKRQPNGSFTVASAVGDPYDEVCRFRRVDGYFEIYPDWQLIDILEFDDNYLSTEAALDTYRRYSEGVVEAKIMGSSLPAKPAGRSITVTPGGYQLIARGIYLDRMTASHKSALESMIRSGESDWKAIAPFYDVNLTLLSSWYSDDPEVATVTNQAIDTIVDPVNDFYGTYSRGRVEALSDGDAGIQVLALGNNTGITGTPAVSPSDVANARVDNSLIVTVDSKSSSEKFYALIGDINCLITVNNAEQSCETNNSKKSNYVDLSSLAITNSPSRFTCPITIPKGKSTPFFSCEDISENWTGDIIFAFSKPGYQVTLKVTQPDGTVVEADRITINPGLEATSTREYGLIIELHPQ
ncbi:prepilin-type N-terminal cleavage/methylation domain-containing protein [Alteromonas sp. ASW11-19]|uniref:Prepilin-type N-terminal cleavage/methylation domain-containing protein n=1 Tax=Alteromonas salexigens TaxID=2982530 RepID=A0ABT2VQY9_9ALTE|nr:prepilin-type N-terminal cleavage/methylation domain-containing protein [Alteromonas salexigens]MCU7555726.1 prepilin-type N-terminal cleavage/methylation domain-containing protein [Alteromonas salexigens]